MQSRFERLKGELKSFGFGLSDDELSDFAHIAEVLITPNYVNQQLDKLEKEVFSDVVYKGIFFHPELVDAYNKGKNFKVLSDTLYNWAIKKGLVIEDENQNAHFIKINRLLNPKQFLNILKQGLFFKDIGVPEKHGSWTHFIQWYIIVEHFSQPQYQGLLHHSPLELYKMLGDEKCLGRKPNSQLQTSVWFEVYDRDSSKDPHDFRSPDNLLSFIKENFPALRKVLSKKYVSEAVIKESKDISDKKYRRNKIGK